MLGRRRFLKFAGLVPICFCCRSATAAGESDPLVCTELVMPDFQSSLEIAIDENPENDPMRQNLPRTEAISLYKKKWNPQRRILNISFIEEPKYLDKVIQNARGWEPHIGMKFRFGNSDPDVLVSFDEGGSWSYIGTDSRYYAQRGRPSMNFGWFNTATADGEFSRVALHEFGHALSLVHEHSHPGGTISWKQTDVIAYYAKQGWSTVDVKNQIFKKYQLSQVNGSRYDPTSIMHYPIDKTLVSDPSDVVGWNEQLSLLDIEVIAKLYPKAKSKLPS